MNARQLIEVEQATAQKPPELMTPAEWKAAGLQPGASYRVTSQAAKEGKPICAALYNYPMHGTPSDCSGGIPYVLDGAVYRPADYKQPIKGMTAEEFASYLDTLKGRAPEGVRSHIGLFFDPSGKRLEDEFRDPAKKKAASEAFAQARTALERKYGSSVVLYRAESAGDAPRSIFSYSFSRKIAEQHARETGRKVTATRVPISAILWTENANGEQEVLVDRREVPAQEPRMQYSYDRVWRKQRARSVIENYLPELPRGNWHVLGNGCFSTCGQHRYGEDHPDVPAGNPYNKDWTGYAHWRLFPGKGDASDLGASAARQIDKFFVGRKCALLWYDSSVSSFHYCTGDFYFVVDLSPEDLAAYEELCDTSTGEFGVLMALADAVDREVKVQKPDIVEEFVYRSFGDLQHRLRSRDEPDEEIAGTPEDYWSSAIEKVKIATPRKYEGD